MTEHRARVLRIERTFDAPVERVFEAWTSEEYCGAGSTACRGTALDERLDLVRRLSRVERFCRCEDVREQVHVAHAVEEDPGRASTQPTATSMSAGSVSGSYHAVCGRPSHRSWEMLYGSSTESNRNRSRLRRCIAATERP
jgi:hypothetical protein